MFILEPLMPNTGGTDGYEKLVVVFLNTDFLVPPLLFLISMARQPEHQCLAIECFLIDMYCIC